MANAPAAERVANFYSNVLFWMKALIPLSARCIIHARRTAGSFPSTWKISEIAISSINPVNAAIISKPNFNGPRLENINKFHEIKLIRMDACIRSDFWLL